MSVVQLFIVIFSFGFGFNGPLQKNASAPKCLDCHQSITGLKVVHPVAESCDICHVSNTKEHPQQGTAGFALTEAVPGMCYTCHDNIPASIQKAVSVHGAISGKKSCIVCHSPHSSAQAKLLVKEEKELCLGCHNKTITTDSSKTENIKLIIDKGKSVHAAIDMDGCRTCHSPHYSAFPNLLKDAFPAGLYSDSKPENFALCFTCHDSQMIIKANSTTATGFRNGDKNLHFIHINGSKGRNCNVCHNVHASQNEHLINDYISFGKWEMPMGFKVAEGGGSCFPGCHGEKKYQR